LDWWTAGVNENSVLVRTSETRVSEDGAKPPLTPILDHVRCPDVVFASRTPAGVSRLGGIVLLAFEQSARWHALLACVFTDCSFGYCRPRDSVPRDHEKRRFSNDLASWADRPPPKDGSETARFRRNSTLWLGFLLLKRHRGKLTESVRNVACLPE
jgi:hypothetical protein